MRIAEHSLELSSQRVAFEATHRSARLTATRADATNLPAPPAAPTAVTATGESPRALPSLSAPAATPHTEARSTVGAAPADAELTPLDNMRMELLRLIVERLTGREIEVLDPSELRPDPDENAETVEFSPPPAHARGPGSVARAGIAWSVEETRIEVEHTSFEARGMVRTADGQAIDIDLSVSMSREFMQHTRVSAGMDAELHDPLVINFHAPAAALTDTRFEFDLDADGHEQQVAFLQSGSGFLAIDRSGSGKVDDGSELFGPLTGDGFAELRRHDHDGNGWIDADDPIYDRLRVWTRDEKGRDQLLALGEVGVGAIYLGHVSTPFDLRHSADNSLLGQVESTGLWINEDGETGSVQQIDLTA
ncbi:hypothetical protein [Thioalkalivibrio sp. ALJ24]|uniref:hypothetical protein n=1 Tax=Thioalkalivibrio sp. ALJ24 TaxID=545276 RepID=UPI0003719602|nr:hypothetical protein [Thioalkalivibrio sp. ALJ24]